MKKILSAVLIAVSISGCVNTSMLTEEQRIEAVRKYPFNEWLNITPDNGVAMTSLKITCRIFADICTYGIVEQILYDDRLSTYSTYVKHDLRYNPLLNKDKVELIKVLGAPDRTFPDGLGGEIYIYETDRISGGGSQHGSWVRSHKEVIEFYYNASGYCYKWRRQIK